MSDNDLTDVQVIDDNPEVPTCGSCGRKRTPQDAYDYNPLQVIMRQPLGWYSGDDSEVCPECMTTLMSGGKR